MLRAGLATHLKRRPWYLWQDCWQWRNRQPSAAQEGEWGDLNLLGIKMRGEDFPGNPKWLMSNWIWMGSPILQGGFENSNVTFHKRERDGRFSILPHLVTAWGAHARQKLLPVSYIFSAPGMTLLYSVNAKVQVPSGLCTFSRVDVYLAWPALTFWFLLLFSPTAAGELWPLLGLWWGCLSLNRYRGDFAVLEWPCPMPRWHLYSPADQPLFLLYILLKNLERNKAHLLAPVINSICVCEMWMALHCSVCLATGICANDLEQNSLKWKL